MSKEGRRRPILPGEEPKPYDRPPYGEPYPQKAIMIRNNTSIRLHIGQLPSDWEHVNFIIEDDLTHAEHDNDNDKTIRPLTDSDSESGLYPGDFIELTFNEPKKLEP